MPVTAGHARPCHALIAITAGLAVAAAAARSPGSAPARATGDLPHAAYLPLALGRVGLDFGPSLAKGGEVAIGSTSEPDSLYLYGGTTVAAQQVLDLLYDGPIDNVGHDHQPSAVERLPLLDDGRGDATVARVTVRPGEPYVDPASGEVVTATAVITGLVQVTARFRLVDGLTWEDGVAVDAADSVLSWRLSCHSDTPTSKLPCDRTVHYTALDARTVEWQGRPGFADPLYFTRFATPLPRHQRGAAGVPLADMPAADVLDDPVFTRRPLSYGPFRVTAWDAGRRIRAERNPFYWRRGEGLPRLDAVELRFLPDDPFVLDQLLAGAVDVLPRTRSYDISVNRLAAADAAGIARLYWVPAPVWDHIDFNVDEVRHDPAHRFSAPLGACLGFRRAVAHGTRRDHMAALVNRGATGVWQGLTPPGHWAAPPAGTDPHPYDPDRARALLGSLGFEDADGDGTREAQHDVTCTVTTSAAGATRDHVIPAGTPARLVLQTTHGSWPRESLALLFQADMKDIGVAVDIELVAAQVLFQDGPAGPIFGRSFGFALFGWQSGYLPPAGLYRCDEIPGPENAWSGQNNTGWCDPAYDRAADAVAAALDRAAARQAALEAQRILAEQVPMLPVLQRLNVAAARADLLFFAPDPTAASDTWNAERWALAVGGAAR